MALKELMHSKQLELMEQLRVQGEKLCNGELHADVVSVLTAQLSTHPETIFLLSENIGEGELIYEFVVNGETIYTIETPVKDDKTRAVNMLTGIGTNGAQWDTPRVVGPILALREFRRHQHSKQTNRILDAIEALSFERKNRALDWFSNS